MTLTFTVPGKPEPQRRARATSRAGFVRMIDDPRNRTYADRIRWAWRDTGATEFGDTPVVLCIHAYFPRPAHHLRKDGSLSAAGRRAGDHYCPTGCDADNIAKAIADALNGYAWTDDRSIVDVRVQKLWSPDRTGMVVVKVQPAITQAVAA